MTKHIITNTDPDSPDDERVVEAVGLELPAAEPPAVPQEFAQAIEAAPGHVAEVARAEPTDAEAQAFVDAAQAKIAKDLKEKYGRSLGGERLWAYTPKPKAAYDLWKRVVDLFVNQPGSLDWTMVALARYLNEREPEFEVKRDLLYDRLNGFAVNDLSRRLKQLGIHIELARPVTIASLRKQLVERRDKLQGKTEEHFKGDFTIRGNQLWINGKSYALQHTATGARRIRSKPTGWLNVEALIDFCKR